MVFLLKNAQGYIVGYDRHPFVLNEGQSQTELDMTFEEYDGRLKMSASQRSIKADGQESSIVTIQSNSGLDAIAVLVNDTPVTVNLVNGAGVLPPIVADEPGFIAIQPADKTQFSIAGDGSLTIMAVQP